MRTKLFLLAAAAATACAPVVPKNQVTAYGLAVGMNQSVARLAAQNRAIANLQKLLTLDAVSFVYRVRGADSTVELKGMTEKASYELIEFVPLAKGWASKATGLRPQPVVDAMNGMTFTTVTGEAHRGDIAQAMMLAEARAARALLTPLAEKCAAEGCSLSGTLTFKELKPEFFDDGIRLTVTASAKVAAEGPLAAADRVAVHSAAATEYGQEKEWDKAMTALNQALADGPNDAKLFALRGSLLVSRGPVVGAPPPVTPVSGQPGAPADDPLKTATLTQLREVVAAFTRAAELDPVNAAYKGELKKAAEQLAALDPPDAPPEVETPPAAPPPVDKAPAPAPDKKKGGKSAKSK